MIFISALGILNYTKRVEDKEFEELGLKMLEDVVNYIRKIWRWPKNLKFKSLYENF